MPAPVDIVAGALPHDAACHWCGPHPVHLLPCDFRPCVCNDGGVAVGIDTALVGG